MQMVPIKVRDNREFAKNHNAMQLKTGKMQGGCRWELIPHDEDGLTVREIATGNTYEAVKAVAKQGSEKTMENPLEQQNRLALL